jgi:hypothetical protein
VDAGDIAKGATGKVLKRVMRDRYARLIADGERVGGTND